MGVHRVLTQRHLEGLAEEWFAGFPLSWDTT